MSTSSWFLLTRSSRLPNSMDSNSSKRLTSTNTLTSSFRRHRRIKTRASSDSGSSYSTRWWNSGWWKAIWARATSRSSGRSSASTACLSSEKLAVTLAMINSMMRRTIGSSSDLEAITTIVGDEVVEEITTSLTSEGGASQTLATISYAEM